MRTDFLTAEDFHGKLNMEIFTNLEKSYNSEQLQSEFGEHMILEKSTVDNFIQELYKNIGGEIVKGKFNDTPEFNEIFEKAKEDLSELSKVNYRDSSGVREVFIMKAKTPEDTLEKGKDNELEKGKIANAFEYSDFMKFKKTGKEIKEKMSGQIAAIEARVAMTEMEIDKCAEECGSLPTEKPYLWGRGAMIKCPYNRFHYALCDHWEGRDLNQPYVTEAKTSIYPSATLEETIPYAKYNQLVDQWIDDQKELQIIRLFENNFEDNEKYELSAEQMLVMGF